MIVNPVILISECKVTEFLLLKKERNINIGTVGGFVQIVRQQIFFLIYRKMRKKKLTLKGK